MISQTVLIMQESFLKKINTKNGKEATIRYPTLDDVIEMTQYINDISREDTYITFSGEQITLDEEKIYLLDLLKRIENGDAVNLLCVINGKIVGITGIERKISARRRGSHIGIYGISVKKEYRGYGVGLELSKSVIEEARKRMAGLKIITLSVYKPNEIAFSMYKKLGFVEYGVLPQGISFHGEFVDEVEMYLSVI